jgi:hypothetical protein
MNLPLTLDKKGSQPVLCPGENFVRTGKMLVIVVNWYSFR